MSKIRYVAFVITGIIFFLLFVIPKNSFAMDCDKWSKKGSWTLFKEYRNTNEGKNFISEYIRKCVQGGKDPDLVFAQAVKRSNYGTVKFLIDFGADVKKLDKEKGLINLSLGNVNVDLVVPLLVKHGANPNKEHPLFQSARMSSEVALKAIVGTGVDINNTELDATVLHVAAQVSKHQFVKLLIDLGADINARTSKGYTPLYIAVGHIGVYSSIVDFTDSESIVRYLLEAGADTNAANNYGRTPLHVALDSGDMTWPQRKKIVEQLLDSGADVLRKDVHGDDPLRKAIKLKRPKLFKLMLGHLEKAAVSDARERDEKKSVDSFCLFSCDPTERNGRLAFGNRLAKLLKTPAIVTKFRKTNGVRGQKDGIATYELQFKAEIELPLGFIAGEPKGELSKILGGANAIGVTLALKELMDYEFTSKGKKWTDSFSLVGTGKVNFRKTEQGWEGYDGIVYPE